VLGGFMGGFSLREGLGLRRNRRSDGAGGSHAPLGLWPEVGDDDVALTGGLQQSARGREGRAVPVRGERPGWAVLAHGPKR
jgi:hypothetical protein